MKIRTFRAGNTESPVGSYILLALRLIYTILVDPEIRWNRPWNMKQSIQSPLHSSFKSCFISPPTPPPPIDTTAPNDAWAQKLQFESLKPLVDSREPGVLRMRVPPSRSIFFSVSCNFRRKWPLGWRLGNPGSAIIFKHIKSWPWEQFQLRHCCISNIYIYIVSQYNKKMLSND